MTKNIIEFLRYVGMSVEGNHLQEILRSMEVGNITDFKICFPTTRFKVDYGKLFELSNFKTHILWETEDKDRPTQICDSNGEVVLALCKVCGKAEIELGDGPCSGNMEE